MAALISILGAGVSGVGAAILAQKKGFEVFVSDFGTIKSSFREKLVRNAIPYEEGKHTTDTILASKEVIKSPGIPFTAPIVQQLLEKGIPVIDEIEFASRYTDAKIIAITGSNGKTTTTLLTHHLLEAARLDVGLAGNVGFSFAEQVALAEHEYYVLEMSSFQLDSIHNFKANIAILLNITPDHLDRYEYQLAKYAASKVRIAMNQQENDVFIFNVADTNVEKALENVNLPQRQIAVQANVADHGALEVKGHTFDSSQFSLKGTHNRFNATCAILAALEIGVSPNAIQRGLDSFINASHRMESVATINEVEYINDSKATNVDAVYYALGAMTRPTVWIVGGKDKGNDYEPLFPLVKEKVKAIICLGADNTKLVETFASQVKILEETNSAEEAVQRANIYAEAGDVVLLSPACASFDLFKNYEQRGDLFKDAVKALQTK